MKPSEDAALNYSNRKFRKKDGFQPLFPNEQQTYVFMKKITYNTLT